jgi:tripartite-type tricarboxylate transporter receptor subunit TctC
MASTELKQKSLERGGEPVAETPEKFSAFIQPGTVKREKIVKDSGASID